MFLTASKIEAIESPKLSNQQGKKAAARQNTYLKPRESLQESLNVRKKSGLAVSQDYIYNV